MTPDTRPLAVRVKALANRFDAMASGAEKQAALAAQVAQNHRRDAQTLHEAAAKIEGVEPRAEDLRRAALDQIRHNLSQSGELGGTRHQPDAKIEGAS